MKHILSRRAFLNGCTLLAASAALGGLTACGGTDAKNSDLPQILIGSDTYPPYIYLNNDGTPAGIDVEIATEAFRRMGYAARFEVIDWEQKTALVESGAIDCIPQRPCREDRYGAEHLQARGHLPQRLRPAHPADRRGVQHRRPQCAVCHAGLRLCGRQSPPTRRPSCNT